MKVVFTDVDQQSVNGRTARAVNRATGEVHTVTIAGGEADFGQLTYQQAYEVYGVTASGARVTQVLIKTETNEPEPDPEAPDPITQIPGYLFHMSAQSGVYSDEEATTPASVLDKVRAWVSPQGKTFVLHDSDNPPELRDYEGVLEVWAPPQGGTGLMVADGGPSTDQKNAYLCIALRTHGGTTGGVSVGTSNTNGNGQRGQLRKGGNSNSKLEIFLDPNVSVVSPDIVSETEHRVVEVVMAAEGAHFEVDGVQVGDASGPYTGGGNPGFGDHLFGMGRVTIAAFWLGNDPTLSPAQKDTVRAWVQSQIDTEA